MKRKFLYVIFLSCSTLCIPTFARNSKNYYYVYDGTTLEAMFDNLLMRIPRIGRFGLSGAHAYPPLHCQFANSRWGLIEGRSPKAL